MAKVYTTKAAAFCKIIFESCFLTLSLKHMKKMINIMFSEQKQRSVTVKSFCGTLSDTFSDIVLKKRKIKWFPSVA